MTDEISVVLNGKQVGHVRKGARGRTAFVYDDAWRQAPDAYPLSLSMPLTAQEHGPSTVEAFLWGLLPDNETVLERWARKYQVSARNVFALISHVGEDCAGAAQFVRPERLAELQNGRRDIVEWLDESDIARRLRILREDHAAWRLPSDTGQFSLAGAQPKTAFVFDDGKWGIPNGRIPTTHILKPPTGQFDGHAENEHVCLLLARSLGLPTATSRVMHFEDEVAIVVDRYDRSRTANRIERIHQEDSCQALGISPTRKYQNEGGPGVATLVDLLRDQSSERQDDVTTFVKAIALNWLIAGTDAHAKNYSLLLATGARVRLAPLYDIASILPYPDIDIRKAKLAMKIGGEYELLAVSLRNWRKLAKELRLAEDEVLNSILQMSEQIPDFVQRIRKQVQDEGLKHGLIDRLADRLIERALYCRKLFDIAA